MADSKTTTIGDETCGILLRNIANSIKKDDATNSSAYYQQYGTLNGYTPSQQTVVLNQNGDINVFLVYNGQNQPIELGSYCCKTMIPKLITSASQYFPNVTSGDIYWDDNTQKCRWKTSSNGNDCVIDTFKIVLNPVGNDGSLFNTESGEKECSLTVDFNYLFKLECENLADILNPTIPVNVDQQTLDEIKKLEAELSNLEAECESITSKLELTISEYEKSYYSMVCDNVSVEDFLKYAEAVGYEGKAEPVRQIVSTQSIATAKTAFGKTGFGGTPFAFPALSNSSIIINANTSVTICINEENGGLTVLQNLLGLDKYQRFLDGDPTSYTCSNVIEMVVLSYESIQNGDLELVFECTTPFGFKTRLKKEIEILTKLSKECDDKVTALETQINTLKSDNELNTAICSTPSQVLETLDVSMTIDVIESNGTLSTVYEFNLFPSIGSGNLYTYLKNHATNSGFYICGEPKQTETFASGCTVIKYQKTELSGSLEPVLSNCAPQDPSDFYCNVQSCMPVKDNILESLFTQSNFTNSVDDLKSFRDSLSQTILASKWLNYTTEITDPDIISKIEDKKITLSLKINNTCSNVCVLVDNIKLNKVCIDGEAETIRVDKSPGFELERIIDNKKSWIKNTTPVSRTFDIANNLGNNRIRQTEYNVNDERLVINTKEIDLDINLASAVEHDVWCYVIDNPCLLTGETIPCSGLTVTDYDGNVVTLPTTQTVADCSVIVQDCVDYFLTCLEASTEYEPCFPTTECDCGKIFKAYTKEPSTVGALWVTCSISGLSFYHISDVSDVQGTITNVTDSFTQISLDELNSFIELIKNYLVKLPISGYIIKPFWGDTLIGCDSCCVSCGGESLDFNDLLTEPLSNIDTVEEFESQIMSELIDVKNRKTLSGYPTLRALYDRYLNSTKYCDTESSKYTYATMEQFAALVGDYWTDIIEQVVPATTIWGSVKIYSNTFFDQQKFKYKNGSLFICDDYSDESIAFDLTVDVDKTTISSEGTLQPNKKVQKCTGVYLKQMNASSEFIGSVTITEGSVKSDSDGEIRLK
jgi:hypothetical protein